LKGAFHVVFKPAISVAGIFVYAICTSYKAAGMARSRVAKGKKRLPGGRMRYYDVPLPNPYAVEIQIVKVRVDVLYPNGLDEKKLDEFSGNRNESEVIT